MANEITCENRKRALLLSLIGARGYKLIRSLAQNKPNEKSYDELKNLVLDHLQPKPNEIATIFFIKGIVVIMKALKIMWLIFAS